MLCRAEAHCSLFLSGCRCKKLYSLNQCGQFFLFLIGQFITVSFLLAELEFLFFRCQLPLWMQKTELTISLRAKESGSTNLQIGMIVTVTSILYVRKEPALWQWLFRFKSFLASQIDRNKREIRRQYPVTFQIEDKSSISNKIQKETMCSYFLESLHFLRLHLEPKKKQCARRCAILLFVICQRNLTHFLTSNA